MGTMAKTSGYRRYSAECKREQVERALGRKQMAIEILEAAQDEVKRKHWYGVSKRGRRTP